MKTTLNLPDDLMREVKIRAAQENRKLQDLIAELIRRGLSQGNEIRNRVGLPLITGGNAAPPGADSPEALAQILLDQEAAEFLR